MKIGTVQERKIHEYRIGLTPACVRSLVRHGHQVYVQQACHTSPVFADAEFEQAGACLVDSAQEVFATCQLIVKVKEPLPDEVKMLRPDQVLFTYLHLAASEDLTQSLIESGARAVAYETVETPDGSLPCLRPMSEIAGRLAVQEGARHLSKLSSGRGVLLGGVPGIQRGHVLILGGGTVGRNATQIAMGMGAQVTVMDIAPQRLVQIDEQFNGRLTTLISNEGNLESALREADLVVGAVLRPCQKAPLVIKREHLQMMKKGSVIVDVAIDQGGCVATSHPTTHDNPTYLVDEIVHYAVTNMPGIVPWSSTHALTSVTMPYIHAIAQKGLDKACKHDPALAKGINIDHGQCLIRPELAMA